VVVVLGASCGSSGGDRLVVDGPTDDEVDTVETPDDPESPVEPDEIEEVDEIDEVDSDGPRVGPLFGSGQADASVRTIEEGSAAELCPADTECDDIDPDAIEPPPQPPFEPSGEYRAFCALLADIEQRSLPEDDDFETFARWFAELDEVVPAGIGADFAILHDVIDQAARLGPEQLEQVEAILSTPRVDEAATVMGAAVDAECYGI